MVIANVNEWAGEGKLMNMNKTTFFQKYSDRGDGWAYSFGFYGDSDDECFNKLKQFLIEEEFNDIPLPPTARRLIWDYLKPDSEGNSSGFVWHPIKIHQDPYQVNGLVLTIYNHNHPNHMELWEGTYGNNE